MYMSLHKCLPRKIAQGGSQSPAFVSSVHNICMYIHTYIRTTGCSDGATRKGSGRKTRGPSN